MAIITTSTSSACPRNRCSSPNPPLLIGGGSRRTLSLAARHADIVSFNIRTTPGGWLDPGSVSLLATQEKVDWVCHAAGERLPGLEFNVLAQCVIITTDRDRAARKYAADWKSYGVVYSLEHVLENPAILIGEVEEIVGKIQQNRERFGFSYYVVFGDSLESFAPVVQRLAGK